MISNNHYYTATILNATALGLSFSELKEILQLIIMILSAVYTILQLIKGTKVTIQKRDERDKKI